MLDEVEKALESANAAQLTWADVLVRQRLKAVGKVARLVAKHHEKLVASIPRPHATEADKLASEILPLADACRFTAKVGKQVLAPRRASFWNGAWWMGRVGVKCHAAPWGIVLILAPGNYPLLLPAVQAIQAVAAGNAVLVKPAPGCSECMRVFLDVLHEAGVPEGVVQILPEAIDYAEEVMRQGVDKVVLTGSVHTGRAVLRQLAETLTPATMELSGCDAVLVLPQAKLDDVVASVGYAMTLNGGATCIAPRRLFVPRALSGELKTKLVERLTSRDHKTILNTNNALRLRRAVDAALDGGAELLCGKLPNGKADTSVQPIVLGNVSPDMEVARSDIFAPVISIIEVEDMSEAIDADRLCPYSLGISIFGPKSFAEHWASKVEAGCVVINDVIVPTADPRVSFGGRDQSGWGVTRGRGGLEEMTRPKTVCTRLGNWKPHLDPVNGNNAELLALLLQVFHADGFGSRFSAMKKMMSIVRKKPDEPAS